MEAEGQREVEVRRWLGRGCAVWVVGCGGVVGLLWSMVSASVHGNVDPTKITIRRIEDALMIYSSKHKGKYPTKEEGLEAVKKLLVNEEVPTDAWGHPFLYASPGPGTSPYGITSLGADGKTGGTGINADIHSWELNE